MTQIARMNYDNEGYFPNKKEIMEKTKYIFLDEMTHTVYFHDVLMNKIWEHRLVLDPEGDGLSIDKLGIYGKTPDGTYVRMYFPIKK